MATDWNDSIHNSNQITHSSPATTRRRIEVDGLDLYKRVAVTIGAAILAVLAALAPIPFGANTVVFASALAYLVPTLWLGPAWGLMAALPTASVIWLQHDAPITAVVALMEVCFIGLLVRIGIRPLLAGGLFWSITAAILLLSLKYGLALKGEWVTAAALPLVGLIAVMGAELTKHGARFLLKAQNPRQPIGQTLRYWITFVTILPLLSLVLIEGRHQLSDAESQARINLNHKAESLRLLLDNYVDIHLDVLRLQAGQIPSDQKDAVSLSERLRTLWHNYPGFISLLVADREGKIVAAAFFDDIEQDLAFVRSNQSVADRMYFTEVSRSGMPFVSNVFRGRGFGNDIISAISVPLSDRSGNFSGIIEGSLNLARFDQLYQLAELDERHEFIVIDADSKILFSDTDSRYRPLQQYFAQDDENNLVASERLYSAGWTAVTKQSYRSAITAASGYFVALVWMLPLAMLLAAMIAGRLAKHFSQPLEQIVEQLRARVGMVHSHRFDRLQSLSEGYQEADEAAEGINALLRTLGRSYDDLEQTIAERNRLNESLNETLNHMDTLVRQRTSDLADALRAAKSANEAKNIFLAKTSHEIRTPMHAIIGINELLRNSELNQEQANYSHLIGDAAESLLALIDEILDFSKIETGQLDIRPEAIQLKKLLQSVTALLRERAQNKGIKLNLDAESAPEWVLLDPVRIRQVLLNLITNAIKFTESGSVNVATSITSRKPVQKLRFTVTDTGVGIPEDRLADIFEPFLQLGNLDTMAQQGSGLGLSICKRVIELSGGQIGVISKLDQGSTFWVELPLELPAEIPVEARRKHKTTLKTNVPPLLVVDDNSVNRQMLAHQLNYLGLDAEQVSSGIDALEYVESQQPEVIWLDCQMPEMDGFETAQRIRRLEIRQPYIVAITAQTSNEARQRCLEAGMDDFVSKPAKLNDIQRAVEAAQGAPASVARAIPEAKPQDHCLDPEVLESWREIEQTGKPSIVEEMLDSIADQLERKLPELMRRIEQKEFTEARATAHQLKGSTATVGANRMAKLLKQLETACLKNSDQLAHQLMERILAEHKNLEHAIDHALKHQTHSVPSN